MNWLIWKPFDLRCADSNSQNIFIRCLVTKISFFWFSVPWIESDKAINFITKPFFVHWFVPHVRNYHRLTRLSAIFSLNLTKNRFHWTYSSENLFHHFKWAEFDMKWDWKRFQAGRTLEKGSAYLKWISWLKAEWFSEWMWNFQMKFSHWSKKYSGHFLFFIKFHMNVRPKQIVSIVRNKGKQYK